MEKNLPGRTCSFVVGGYRKTGKAKQYQRLRFNYSPREHYLTFVGLLNSPRTGATC